ncbi:MAG: alginate lyase family protein [Bacteroidales bacterium]|nr:alginate lyase family protein [Bacteroidales bacterium]
MRLSLKTIIEVFRHTPPKLIIRRAYHLFLEKYNNKHDRYKDLHSDTREKHNFPIIEGSFIKLDKINVSDIKKEVAEFLCKMYMDHRYDLLGSGWIRNNHSSEVPGLDGIKFDMNLKDLVFDEKGGWLEKILNKNHTEKSKKIWTLISQDYIPIDWQKDYKSGFRWKENLWYKDQRGLNKPGCDLKVPWELARMQHLSQMAFFALVLPEMKNEIIGEFRNQVLDFTATNPPRMGVCWTCTMDVAIRAANLIIAYDILSQIDEARILDNSFKQLFSNTIYEHGIHIANNLEFSEVIVSNHYLSNISGLFFIALYLYKNDKVKSWLAFSIQELIHQTKVQFNEDGSNYEASTSYHRLSSELIIYPSAIILGNAEKIRSLLGNYKRTCWHANPPLKKPKQQKWLNQNEILPGWFIQILRNAADFTYNLTKQNGRIAQIGDNDSGRLFRFSPVGEFIGNNWKKYLNLSAYEKTIYQYSSGNENFWDEDQINHSALLSSFKGIFSNFEYNPACTLEYSLIKCFLQNYQSEITAIPKTFVIKKHHKTSWAFSKESVFKPDAEINQPLYDNLQFKCFPDFGLYIFRSDLLYLAISAGPTGHNKKGGHGHNDKLSFDLYIDGKDVIFDPGTYLYTPIPEMRNYFRSTKVHNTVQFGNEEQNNFTGDKRDLFKLIQQHHCEVIEKTDQSLGFLLSYRNYVHARYFIITDDRIIIKDFSDIEFNVNYNNFNYFSNGYGKLIKLNGV